MNHYKTNHYKTFGQQSAHYFNREHDGIPEGALHVPAAWSGREMREKPQEWRIDLTSQELMELDATTDRLLSANADIAGVDQASFTLPTLGPRISGWGRTIREGRGFVVVHGLPIADWGLEKTTLAYWGIGHHLGVPGAQNPQGELLGHIIDYGEVSDDPMVRRYRTSGNIDFHCDAADAVGLLCLQPAKTGGQSRIVSSVAVFNQLVSRAPELVPRLFEPFYLDRRNEQRPGQPGHLLVQPCCWSTNSGLKTFYHSEYYRSAARFDDVQIDAKANALLDFYDELCLDPEYQLDMWLEPGDMQFISNHTILHARTAYEDWEDPERRRHLLRLWTSL